MNSNSAEEFGKFNSFCTFDTVKAIRIAFQDININQSTQKFKA